MKQRSTIKIDVYMDMCVKIDVYMDMCVCVCVCVCVCMKTKMIAHIKDLLYNEM